MNSPRRPDGPAIYDGKSYSAAVHLAEDVRPFVAIANGLRERGFSAPAILHADLDTGFLITEDLGTAVFVEGAPPTPIALRYQAATDMLVALHRKRLPVTLPLAPGQYNLVLRLQGYEAYAGNVQVKDNIQTTLDAELKEKATSRVAWADVTSTPKGAEIVIDGTSTGQFSPARVQVTAGGHVVTLRMEGYQPVRRTIQVTEGSSVTVEGTLRPK